MRLGHTGQTLYAVENAGADDLFYFFFRVGAGGTLTNIGQIGPNVDYVSPLVFSPDNNFAYGSGCFHASWNLTGFRRNGDGTLTPIGGTNQAVATFDGTGQMYCPEGEAVSQAGYMAVGVAELGSNKLGVGVYKINSDGSLTIVPASTQPVLLPQNNGCCGELAMNSNRSGLFLAIANPGGIQTFQLAPAGTLTRIGGLQQAGPNYTSVQWDADNHLYATSWAGLPFSTVSQGVLSPASGSPHAAGPAGSLTVLPTH